jgi:hypothetical protein
VVILFLLFRLNLGKTTDQETCYNSVVQRGSGVLPEESVPLNCETQYICITKDGSCEKMTSPQIEKVKNDKEVYNVLANQMADCWWMFGEGKLNYVGKDFKSELYCSICSQIGFDNSVSSIFSEGQIDEKLFYSYLSKLNKSDEISYLEYITGMTDTSTIIQNLGTIDISKPYYVMMGIFSKVGIEKWSVLGAAGFATGVIVISAITVLTGGAALPGFMVLVGAGIGGGTGYFAGTVFSGDSGHQYLRPTIIEANSETFESLKCALIKTIG